MTQETARQHVAVTASDTTILPKCQAVVCLTAGNCAVQDVNDVIVTYPLTAGQHLWMSPKRIRAASTGTYSLLR